MRSAATAESRITPKHVTHLPRVKTKKSFSEQKQTACSMGTSRFSRVFRQNFPVQSVRRIFQPFTSEVEMASNSTYIRGAPPQKSLFFPSKMQILTEFRRMTILLIIACEKETKMHISTLLLNKFS